MLNDTSTSSVYLATGNGTAFEHSIASVDKWRNLIHERTCSQEVKLGSEQSSKTRNSTLDFIQHLTQVKVQARPEN